MNDVGAARVYGDVCYGVAFSGLLEEDQRSLLRGNKRFASRPLSQGRAKTQRLGAFRRVLGVGHEHQAKEDSQGRSVVALEITLVSLAQLIRDGDRESRDYLLVDALPEALGEPACVDARRLANLLDRAPVGERLGGEEHVQVSSPLGREQRKVELDKGLGPPALARRPRGRGRVQPDDPASHGHNPRQSIPVGVRPFAVGSIRL